MNLTNFLKGFQIFLLRFPFIYVIIDTSHQIVLFELKPSVFSLQIVTGKVFQQPSGDSVIGVETDDAGGG